MRAWLRAYHRAPSRGARGSGLVGLSAAAATSTPIGTDNALSKFLGLPSKPRAWTVARRPARQGRSRPGVANYCETDVVNPPACGRPGDQPSLPRRCRANRARATRPRGGETGADAQRGAGLAQHCRRGRWTARLPHQEQPTPAKASTVMTLIGCQVARMKRTMKAGSKRTATPIITQPRDGPGSSPPQERWASCGAPRARCARSYAARPRHEPRRRPRRVGGTRRGLPRRQSRNPRRVGRVSGELLRGEQRSPLTHSCPRQRSDAITLTWPGYQGEPPTAYRARTVAQVSSDANRLPTGTGRLALKPDAMDRDPSCPHFGTAAGAWFPNGGRRRAISIRTAPRGPWRGEP